MAHYGGGIQGPRVWRRGNGFFAREVNWRPGNNFVPFSLSLVSSGKGGRKAPEWCNYLGNHNRHRLNIINVLLGKERQVKHSVCSCVGFGFRDSASQDIILSYGAGSIF